MPSAICGIKPLPRAAWLPAVVSQLQQELTHLTAVGEFLTHWLALGIGRPESPETERQAVTLQAAQEHLHDSRERLWEQLRTTAGRWSARRLSQLPWSTEEQHVLAQWRERLQSAAARLAGVVQGGRGLLEQRAKLLTALQSHPLSDAPYVARYTPAGELNARHPSRLASAGGRYVES